MILVSLVLIAAAPAGCPIAKPTAAERIADAAVIRGTAGPRLRAGEIAGVMRNGRWKAVWATPAEAERGVYFLRRDTAGRWRMIEVWGGVIAPDERRQTIAWARALGRDMPAALATCFADALLAGN